MEFDKFCDAYLDSPRSEIEKAVGFIWYLMRSKGLQQAYFPTVIECFRQAGLAIPNTSRLRAALRKHPSVLRTRDTDHFRIERYAATSFDQSYGELLNESPIATPLVSQLRSHASRIKNSNTRQFVLEAIGCMEARLYRAAIVFSWIGAVAVLQDNVASNRLADLSRDLLSSGITKTR